MVGDSLILTLNGGSSSLKFATFDLKDPDERMLGGHFDRIGHADGRLHLQHRNEGDEHISVTLGDHRSALLYLFDTLAHRVAIDRIAAVAHRVVHGGQRYADPIPIDNAMLAELHRLSSFAPEHLPAEISIISACRERLGQVPQIACFDTAFHRDMPAVARMLPIPRRFQPLGVERYGFHGLSYTYLMQVLRRNGEEAAARGRLILAHLGNGVSLAAVHEGRSVDTTMAFTPAAGVPMSTRSGDLDPGLVRYFAEQHDIDAKAFDHMVNHESGMLGISETSSDLRDLLEHEGTDSRAAEAVMVFCYGIRKAIGALAAALGGTDMIVFTGGIGENAPVIRERVCDGLGFLGVELDAARNRAGASVISREASRVQVRVMATDEEAVLAQAAAAFITRGIPA